MKSATVKMLLIGVGLIGLGACNRMGQPAGNGSESADASGPAAPAANDDAAAAKKLDSYVEAHNTFYGTFGFEEKADAYRKANIAHASTSGYFNVDAGWISQGLDKLKAALAMPGGSADLDAAATALIASMGKVQAHLANLETYYSGKKYLDDKLARGKAEDPQVRAELDAAEKDLTRFSALLDGAIDQRDAALLAKLKAADPLKYDTKLALIHAKKLVNLFDGPADAHNPALFAKGDAEVAIIEQAIADAHQEAGKKGKTDPSGLSSLTTMVGAYRSLKQGHEVRELKAMIEDYNQAVEQANTFGQFE